MASAAPEGGFLASLLCEFSDALLLAIAVFEYGFLLNSQSLLLQRNLVVVPHPGLEGNWGVETREPFNLVTFHFVHPPNVSTVVFGMKQPVLMHSRKTVFFCLERTQFVASEHKVPGQPKRRRAFGTAQG